MYGITDAGNSLVVHVYNFQPYFFMQVPQSMQL